MTQKSLFILSAFLALAMLINIASFASAEIIWSLPTEVEFQVVNSTMPPTLQMHIIKPEANKVYYTRSIPLIVETNIPATCSYSLDNAPSGSLGTKNYFSRILNVLYGKHKISVTCTAGNQTVTKSVNFTSKKKCESKPNIEEETDDEIEDQFHNPVYGEWTCINNRFQRWNIIEGIEELEYGGVCGLELPASGKTSGFQFSFWYALLFMLIFLIVLLLVLIIAIAARLSQRRQRQRRK